MLVDAIIAQPPERLIQLIQIVLVLTTRAPALHNMLSQSLWILRAKELRIVWQANIHETFNGFHWLFLLLVIACGEVERRVLHAVAIDLAYVEVLADFCDLR